MKALKKWIIYLLAGLLLLTVVPVLGLRWLPVPTSSVIVQRTLSEGAWQYYR